MPRVRSWRQLLPGLLALALVTAGAVAVLVFARVGALHGGTMRVYAATEHARGLLPGSEVWLAGQKVGAVAAVGFGPPSADTTGRVLLALDVLDEAAPQLRADAPVQIRPGGNLIGAPVVALGAGSLSSRALAEGDTLRSVPGRDLDAMRAELAGVAPELPVIIENVRLLGAQLRSARGTLGALGVDGGEQLGATARAAGALADRARHGEGTIGRSLAAGGLVSRAQLLLARTRDVRERVASTGTSVGRLRGDTALLGVVTALRADVAAVGAALAEPRGTVGRLQRDANLARQLELARLELDALVADLQRNPARYLNF